MNRKYSENYEVLQRLVSILMIRKMERRVQYVILPELESTIKSMYFLLDVDQRGDVESFMTHALDRLLRQFRSRTEQRQVERKGQVRGHIIWKATETSRYTKEFDHSRYICREVLHQYDTLQNQLVKYMIERISECMRQFPEALRGGICYFPATSHRQTISIDNRVDRIEAALDYFYNHPRIRNITLPHMIDEEHLLKAETTRVQEYALVAHLYRRYRATVLAKTWKSVLEVGERVLLLPGRLDNDGDSWIRIGAEMLYQLQVKLSSLKQ